MKKYAVLCLIIVVFIAALQYLFEPADENNTTSTKSTENMKWKESLQIITNDKNNKKTIKSPTVYSIKSPVAGNYPQGLFKYPHMQNTNSDEIFTQTLEWFPKIEKTFAVDTQYTAVLTLNPIFVKNTFDGLGLEDVKGLPVNNVSDITFDIANDSMVIKIIFDKTASEKAEPELLFYDDFDGDKLDYTNWETCPNWDRHGNSTWDDDLVSVGNGYLHLGFVRDRDLGELKTSDSNLSENWIKAGAIRSMWCDWCDNTNIIYENTFGYYEARIKFPAVSGVRGTFWLMSPTEDILTDNGVIGTEIDIIESIYNTQNKYNAALRWDGYDVQYKSIRSEETATGINIYDGEFHIFAVDWSPGEYIFYVDGIEFWRCDGGERYNDCGINQNPNYLKLTVEGAAWAGSLPSDFTESEMLVDYVRVYNQPKIN